MTRADEVLEAITAIVVRHLPLPRSGSGFPPDRDLFELGLDSITAVRLLLEIEEMYGVEFSESAISAELFSSLTSLHTAVLQLFALSQT